MIKRNGRQFFNFFSINFLSLFFLSIVTIDVNGMYRFFEQTCAAAFRSTHIPVFMNDMKMVTLSADAFESKIISTRGLVGCFSTIFYVRNEKNLKSVFLTHYPFSNKDIYLNNFLKQMQDLNRIIDFKKTNYIHCCIVLPEYNPFNMGFIDIDIQDYISDCEKIYQELENVLQEQCMLADFEIKKIMYHLPGFNFKVSSKAQIDIELSNQNESYYVIRDYLEERKIYFE